MSNVHVLIKLASLLVEMVQDILIMHMVNYLCLFQRAVVYFRMKWNDPRLADLTTDKMVIGKYCHYMQISQLSASSGNLFLYCSQVLISFFSIHVFYYYCRSRL